MQYEHPGAPLPPVAAAAAPPVVKWFRVYAALMALLYLVVGLLIVALLFYLPQAPDDDRFEATVVAVTMIPLSAFFLLAYAVSLFLPRKPWVWIYDIVLIGIGMTSCLTLPAAIPLLVFWIRPEAKAHFGRL